MSVIPNPPVVPPPAPVLTAPSPASSSQIVTLIVTAIGGAAGHSIYQSATAPTTITNQSQPIQSTGQPVPVVVVQPGATVPQSVDLKTIYDGGLPALQEVLGNGFTPSPTKQPATPVAKQPANSAPVSPTAQPPVQTLDPSVLNRVPTGSPAVAPRASGAVAAPAKIHTASQVLDVEELDIGPDNDPDINRQLREAEAAWKQKAVADAKWAREQAKAARDAAEEWYRQQAIPEPPPKQPPKTATKAATQQVTYTFYTRSDADIGRYGPCPPCEAGKAWIARTGFACTVLQAPANSPVPYWVLRRPDGKTLTVMGFNAETPAKLTTMATALLRQ